MQRKKKKMNKYATIRGGGGCVVFSNWGDKVGQEKEKVQNGGFGLSSKWLEQPHR
jgi:hypothetical protein